MRQLKNIVFAVVLFFCTSVLAGDWPQWRGPFFNGSSNEKDLPASWSETENICWIAPLPGPSGATPIIWDGKVFVSSMVDRSGDYVALCLDARTGKQLWRKEVGSNSRRYPRNNMASPSPVTDGVNVFFLYGDGELIGFDLEGNKLWSRNIEKEYGNLAVQFGYSNSPNLFDGKLYILVLRRDTPYRKPEADGPLDSFFMAVNPKTGETIWKQPRKTNVFDESFEAYGTTVPFVRNGKTELLNIGADFITSSEPVTGEELWRYEYWTDKIRDSRIIPSLVTGDGLVFGARHKNNGVFALQPPTSDEDKGRVVWEFDDAAPDCSTPLFYKGRLYVLDGMRHGKVVTCLDPKTGEQFWQARIGGRGPWRASLTAGDDKIYCINETGEVVVFKASDEKFELLFETKIDERPIQSSIAIAGGRLFIRTAENLYCIGK